MGGEAASTASEYFPISIDLYETDQPVDIDLYLYSGNTYVLYKVRDLPWTAHDRKRLVENRIAELFGKFDSRAEYLAFMEGNLSRIIANPNIPVREKSDILYQTSTALISELFEQPHRGDLLERSIQFVDRTVELVTSTTDAFFQLLDLASHHYYTYTHSVNVCAYSVALAKQLGIRFSEDLRGLGTGALLHDIGKAEIASSILEKKSKLTDEEWAIMRRHPTTGHAKVESVAIMPSVSRRIILEHHERLDGTGYPRSIQSSEIHLFSKIVSICDCFDAMTTDRAYQPADRAFDALRHMKEDGRKSYDPTILNQFIHLLHREDR